MSEGEANEELKRLGTLPHFSSPPSPFPPCRHFLLLWVFGLTAGTKSALPRIAVSGYQSLGLQYYFTCGPDEVRAWTIRRGTKAPQAAGVIHTDFEKTFVVGEIMKFDDLKELGSEAAVKAAGKYITKGKEYEVLDGDICYWKAGKK
jgi:obg-like ATPase 1